MHFAPDENLIRQYLQDEEIARDFGAYYQLYAKYRQDYRIPEILSGSLDESVVESLCTLAAHAPTDERLTVAGLLLDGWNILFLKSGRRPVRSRPSERTPSGQSLTS